jgi:hypothetical protein
MGIGSGASGIQTVWQGCAAASAANRVDGGAAVCCSALLKDLRRSRVRQTSYSSSQCIARGYAKLEIVRSILGICVCYEISMMFCNGYHLDFRDFA